MGLMVQVGDTPRAVAIPLPREVDNTTAQLLALAMGRRITACLRDLAAPAGEVVCDAQAVESVVVGCAYQQRDPLRKAIQCSSTLS